MEDNGIAMMKNRNINIKHEHPQLFAHIIILLDINECANDKDNECDKDLDTCRNTDGSYECDCDAGYRKEAGRDSECIGK